MRLLKCVSPAHDFRSPTGLGLAISNCRFGLPTTVSLAWGGQIRYVSYYHDDGGRLWRLTHPDNANFYHYYDSARRMSSVLEEPATGLDNYLVRYWYNAAGRRSAAVRGANAIGFGTNYYRDALERPTVIANDLPGTAALLISSAAGIACRQGRRRPMGKVTSLAASPSRRRGGRP